MKILFTTDIHFRATRPISRLDSDYLGTILGKIEQIRQLAISLGVDLVLLGGDIFDRPDSPHSVVIRVNRAFSNFPCPVETIIGNHDIYGYEGLTVEATALGSLFEMGNVKRLDARTIGDVSIYGMHAFDKEEWQVPPSDGVKVLVVHKQLTDSPYPGGKCILLEEAAKLTNADLILSGDIHYPHHQQIGRHLFVNPGSLSRGSIVEKDRAPQVAIINITAAGISVDYHTLHSKPPEQLFDLKAYSERMASEAHTKDFIRTYVSAVISVKSESTHLGDVLIEFLEKNGIGDQMRRALREYLARAEKEVLKETKE